MTEREKFEAFAQQMGHTRPGVPAASAPPAAKTQQETGNAAKTQRDAGGPRTAKEDARGAMLRLAQEEARRRTMASKAAENAEKAARAEAELKKRKPNKFENAFMMDMMILRNSLAVRREAVRERLSEVNPHAWRDLQLLYSLVCRIQEQLVETMPESRQEYYETLARNGRYHLEIQGPIHAERTVLISDKHLGAILDAVIESECMMCLKDGNEINKCKIREALLEVGPPTEIIEDGIGCEYRDVPGQLIRGEIVTV